jgi:hypothetical protein
MVGRTSSDLDPVLAWSNAYHWNTMVVAVDTQCLPCGGIHTLACEIDDTIGGFVRGQSALCLILAVFYAGALNLIGSEHGALIGFTAGPTCPSFLTLNGS